tara:strand:+ start:378 stop:1490 length:1113 start_codon:yes stop_codon:yes gene_type:complete
MATILPPTEIAKRNRKVFAVPSYKKNPFQEYYETGTFENQRKFAKDIVEVFKDPTMLHVLAVAPTQSGKTGTMLATFWEFAHQQKVRVRKEHMFIFTGISSLEWTEQTRSRFPHWMSKHIFHRNQLQKAIEQIQHLDNVLIIIDECHVAAKPQQTLHKFAQAIWKHDNQSMRQKNIKLVQFTATPDQLLQKYQQQWDCAHTTLYMDVPQQYVSVEQLEHMERIKHAKDLCGSDNEDNMDEQVKQNILELVPILKHMKPAYHIIRTPRAKKHHKVIRNMKQILSTQYTFISTIGWDNRTFDHTLQNTPNTHTFLFIKDKLRCAKTITHTHIGILYEFVTTRTQTHTITQGLLGRNTGYHHNHTSIVFTKKN